MFALLIGASCAIAAPVPKLAPGDKELRARADAARLKMVTYLKGRLGKDGTWEDRAGGRFATFEGGTTALVVLALLDAGVPANDAVLEKALPFLAALAPKYTYSVSLATRALARADAKKYATEIRANVDWLMTTAITKGDRLLGWSYPADRGTTGGDGSNTHFALAALDAAQTAGASADAKLWGKVRDLYARTQAREGGWSYCTEFAPPSASMTVTGLLALALADKHDKPAHPNPVFAKGMAALMRQKSWSGPNEGCALFAQAELGRALGTAEIRHENRSRAWYRECAERVFGAQAEDGSVSFTGVLSGAGPVLDTAFALYALGWPAK